MIPKLTGPGWPDMRGWVAIGFFVLTAGVLLMIRENPLLLANASFMQLIGQLAGAGGLGLIATFLFGASKTGSDKNDTINAQARALAEKNDGEVKP